MTINGIHRTMCMTFPRSGHHWTVRVLTRYFGARLAYCEMYQQPHLMLAKCPTTNFQKNHDFELSTPVTDDLHYIVALRDPLDALPSRFQLELDQGTSGDNEASWRWRMSDWADYYAGFVKKWVYSPVPNRFLMRFHELENGPAHVLARVISFLADEQVDPEKLDWCISNEPFRKRDWPAIRYSKP